MAVKHDQLLATRYTLLSRIADVEDQESWRDFFDTYWRLIYGNAISAGLTEAEAQDVVQETVICVARDIQKFKRDRKLGSFKGWLKNIIRWRIADQFRRRLPRTPADELSDSGLQGATEIDELAGSAAPDLDAEWDREWQQNLLQAAVDRVKHRVKEEHFQIFDLYALKGRPVNEVAQRLHVNVATVYLAKHRVAARIKKELQHLEKNGF